MKIKRTKRNCIDIYLWTHNPSHIYQCKNCPYSLTIPFRELLPCGNNQCMVVINQTDDKLKITES